MQQTIGITLILSVFFVVTLVGGDSFAASNSKSRPIQIVSDPYGVGNPTHYSVIRGTTKITFSHPLAGQFGRAEISVREQTGTKTTRFILSPDGKTYRVALQMETPFSKHNSTSEAAICPDPNGPTPIKLVRLLKGKVVDGEEIAQKRDELTKAKFFDASCFSPSFSEDHRNALFNAAADVLTTSTQDGSPEPKYLRCLEKYGFSHESGTIQALVKQSLTDTKVNPRVRITCTADKNAKAGQFDDQTREVSIKKTFKANREDYAVKVFHELLHTAPLSDGTPLAAMEECCTMGEQCSVLKELGEFRKVGDRKLSQLERLDGKNTIATSEMSLLTTPGEDALIAGRLTQNKSDITNTTVTSERSVACALAGPSNCTGNTFAAFRRASSASICFPPSENQSARNDSTSVMLKLVLPSAFGEDAPSRTCNKGILDGLLSLKTQTSMKFEDKQSAAQLMETVPQSSPIEWDNDKAIPLRMASTTNVDSSDATAPVEAPKAPSRTIASISPLPEPQPQRQLGSANNRPDVATGRASIVVDTMESSPQSYNCADTRKS